MAAGNSAFSPVPMEGVAPVSSHPPWSWITAPLPCQGLYPPSSPPFCCPICTPPPPPRSWLCPAASPSAILTQRPRGAGPFLRPLTARILKRLAPIPGLSPPPTPPLPGPWLTPTALHVPPLPGMFHPSQPHLGANPTRPSNPSSNVSSPTKLCPPQPRLPPRTSFHSA